MKDVKETLLIVAKRQVRRNEWNQIKNENHNSSNFKGFFCYVLPLYTEKKYFTLETGLVFLIGVLVKISLKL